jgi:ribosomal protein L3 glutamine methyltransferase
MTSHDVLPYLDTIRDLIRWGASRMNEVGLHFGHGTDNALDEAAALVLHALHLPPDLQSDYFQARLTPPEKQAALRLLERRVSERRPAAYLPSAPGSWGCRSMSMSGCWCRARRWPN